MLASSQKQSSVSVHPAFIWINFPWIGVTRNNIPVSAYGQGTRYLLLIVLSLVWKECHPLNLKGHICLLSGCIVFLIHSCSVINQAISLQPLVVYTSSLQTLISPDSASDTLYWWISQYFHYCVLPVLQLSLYLCSQSSCKKCLPQADSVCKINTNEFTKKISSQIDAWILLMIS